ncbi:BMC domain-containing protein [Ignavibacterium sp.]|jgi:microcompartment protein CcmL/EutN|uniref:BMC domain-containing protein n=1 Tax=Ignavibacterium sp. TaxID=2651167 RepID=UPI0025BABC1A|nr:BMC domain-containing protein [Ignavibacterium sp.]
MSDSLGLVEVKGFCASVFAVDALLKNSSVAVSLEELNNGNVILELKGPLPQIKYAINLAIENANKISSVLNYSVLEKLNPTVEKVFFDDWKKTRIRKSVRSDLIVKSESKSELESETYKVKSDKLNPVSTKKVTSKIKSTKKISDDQITARELNKVNTIERLRLEALGKKSLESAKPENEKIKSTPHYNVKKLSDLHGLNVHKLRRAARDFDEFPIKGRQISMAGRDELMVYFKQILPE